ILRLSAVAQRYPVRSFGSGSCWFFLYGLDLAVNVFFVSDYEVFEL
ncbi:hypothetical protein A2U01_0098712, partial [Trifolium medium]|nr:hypothetical protein [Trifolium medium]